MKICAIICEYNPFHNGHLYQLNEAKKRSGADAVLCVMSGNFVQRGEAAILDKFTRARHAVLAGADAVLELPTAFATSNAELFAKGAIKLLSSIPEVETLCFGTETADAELFKRAAVLLSNEPKEVSAHIKTLLTRGVSYAKARAAAWEDWLPNELLCSPNNILGLEYAKAILSLRANIEILPIERKGSGYLSAELCENYSSATAIRQAVKEGKNVRNQLPDFVNNDLVQGTKNKLEILEKYALLTNSSEEIARVCDCGEGLENALKRVAGTNEPLVETLTSARYTASRIRRIALQNLLRIEEGQIRESLDGDLYLRVLSAKSGRNDLLSVLGKANAPLLIRSHDENQLNETQKKCYETDLFAEKIYSLLSETEPKKDIFI